SGRRHRDRRPAARGAPEDHDLLGRRAHGGEGAGRRRGAAKVRGGRVPALAPTEGLGAGLAAHPLHPTVVIAGHSASEDARERAYAPGNPSTHEKLLRRRWTTRNRVYPISGALVRKSGKPDLRGQARG